jgi:hypothetical protein
MLAISKNLINLKLEVSMARPKEPTYLLKAGELYLTYNERRTGGEPDDPADRWTNHSDEHIEFTPTGLFTQKCSFQETFEVPFDPAQFLGKQIHVVVVRYYDGSTFGRICGLWKVVGAFTDSALMQKVVEIIDRGKDSQELSEKLAPLTCYGYYPWFGYFAGYEGVEVHEFTLRKVYPLDEDEDNDDTDLRNPPPRKPTKWVKH